MDREAGPPAGRDDDISLARAAHGPRPRSRAIVRRPTRKEPRSVRRDPALFGQSAAPRNPSKPGRVPSSSVRRARKRSPPASDVKPTGRNPGPPSLTSAPRRRASSSKRSCAVHGQRSFLMSDASLPAYLVALAVNGKPAEGAAPPRQPKPRGRRSSKPRGVGGRNPRQNKPEPTWSRSR